MIKSLLFKFKNKEEEEILLEKYNIAVNNPNIVVNYQTILTHLDKGMYKYFDINF